MIESVNPYNPPATPVGLVEIMQAENPHTLWKQIVGVAIASLVMFPFGGIFIVLTGVFAFVDAWHAGIYKKTGSKAFLNLSPMAWGIAMVGLLIVALPLYLINRNKLKTKEGNIAFFVLTILFGILTFAMNAYVVFKATSLH